MSADFPYECAHCGHGELSQTSSSGCSNCGSQGAIIPRIRADAVFARPVMENIDPLLSEYTTRKTGTLMDTEKAAKTDRPQMFCVSGITSEQEWYGSEWRITVKRSPGPGMMSIRPSDLPEDIRAGLIAWLQS